ncbi:MAG: cupin domain-containing protein [Chloroflexota bacterium]
MANTPQKIHVDAIEKEVVGNGDKFAATIGTITQLMGMTKLGCTMVEIEPGKRAWPYHLHYGQEELFIILEGEGTLRYDDEEYPITQGEIFFAPIGEGTAHQIMNTSDTPMRYLALSSMSDPEVCYYPDSQKYGSYSDLGLQFLSRKESAVEYMDGEV